MFVALVTLRIMSVTGVSPAPRDSILTQVDRLVNSEILRGSESLCRLLRYLAEHTIENPGVPIKEYQIATEVFGRAADFDPRLDSTVRVQTGRLRSKLTEYYGGAGLEDRTVIELPKGSYSLSIHERPVQETAPVAVPVPATPSPVVAAPQPQPATSDYRPRGLLGIVWTLGLAVLLLVIGLILSLLNRPRPAANVSEKAPQVVQTFWRGFIDQPDRPLVVFSNAAFVGRPESGMRYFDPQRDANSAILDHYTGVGEVIAVHELDRLFATLGHEIHVKRGRLLSLDDAKSTDLIFLGSPTENLNLRELPSTQEFVFRLSADGPRKGDLQIVNLKPRSGEAVTFFGSPSIPINEDHALIALTPGLTANRWVLLLAGTTTIGTQAAVEFVTRPMGLEELVTKAGTRDGLVKPFEAVIKVKVSGGVPVSGGIVAMHPHN